MCGDAAMCDKDVTIDESNTAINYSYAVIGYSSAEVSDAVIAFS